MTPEDWRLAIEISGPFGACLIALMVCLNKRWLITGSEAREIERSRDREKEIGDRFLALADRAIMLMEQVSQRGER